MWLHSLKVAQLLRSAACLHTNQSRSYLNHLVSSLAEPYSRAPVRTVVSTYSFLSLFARLAQLQSRVMNGTIPAVYVTTPSCFTLLYYGSLKENVVRRSFLLETCTGHLAVTCVRSTRVRLCQKTPTCPSPLTVVAESRAICLICTSHTVRHRTVGYSSPSRLTPVVMRLTPIRNVSGSNPWQGSMLVVVPSDELEPRPLWLPCGSLLSGVLSVSIMKQ